MLRRIYRRVKLQRKLCAVARNRDAPILRTLAVIRWKCWGLRNFFEVGWFVPFLRLMPRRGTLRSDHLPEWPCRKFKHAPRREPGRRFRTRADNARFPPAY